MADLSKLRFNGTDYNVKDASAPKRKFDNTYAKTGNLPISSDDTTQTAIGKLEKALDENQTNILYAMKRTGENYLPVTSGTVNNGNVMKLEPVYIKAGYYTFSFKANTGFSGAYEIDFYQADGTTKYAIQGQVSSSVVRNFQLTNDIYYVTLYFSGAVTVSEVMVCHELRYSADNSFVDYSLPNSDLTRLEAEDRAALAEVVDSGAKNLLKRTATGSSWTSDNVTFTLNSDGSITINSSGAITANKSFDYFTGKLSDLVSAGTYVLFANASPNSQAAMWWYFTDDWNEICETTSNDHCIISASDLNRPVVVRIRALAGNAISNVKVYPMICTKAAFGVSQKFVPRCVPIKGVYARDTAVVCSTTLTTTGIKFTATEKAAYRITATAIYYNSIPLKLVIKYKTNSSANQLPFCSATHADGEDVSLIASGIISLDVGGEFEVFAQYASSTSNYFYVLVEKIG